MGQFSGKGSLVECVFGKLNAWICYIFTEHEHLLLLLTLFKRTPMAGIVLPHR